MILEKLEQAGRVPSKDKFRRMACNTFIFTGACPYNDRCVFLHDYRIKAEGVKVRTTRQTRSNNAIKDTFYWPDMTRKDVIRNTDAQGLPSANQMYVIPEAFKTNPTNFHNRGLYSIWAHFVEFCVHNAIFYIKKYRDLTSEPFFQTCAYRENPHVPGAKRLDTFVQLSMGIAASNRVQLTQTAANPLVEEMRIAAPREEQQDKEYSGAIAKTSASSGLLARRSTWSEGQFKSVLPPTLGATSMDEGSNFSTPVFRPLDVDFNTSMDTYVTPARGGFAKQQPLRYSQATNSPPALGRFSPQPHRDISPDSVILPNRSLDVSEGIREDDEASFMIDVPDAESIQNSLWEGMVSDTTKGDPWASSDYRGADSKLNRSLEPRSDLTSYSSLTVARPSSPLAELSCDSHSRPVQGEYTSQTEIYFPPVDLKFQKVRDSTFSNHADVFQKEREYQMQRLKGRMEDAHATNTNFSQPWNEFQAPPLASSYQSYSAASSSIPTLFVPDMRSFAYEPQQHGAYQAHSYGVPNVERMPHAGEAGGYANPHLKVTPPPYPMGYGNVDMGMGKRYDGEYYDVFAVHNHEQLCPSKSRGLNPNSAPFEYRQY